MSPVLSTPAGATVTYLSSTWPWSIHASSRNMTFWNELLSALAQFSLFSSSTAIQSSTAATTEASGTTTATTDVGHFISTSSIYPSSVTLETPSQYYNLNSNGNAGEPFKQSINQLPYFDRLPKSITTNAKYSDGEYVDTNAAKQMNATMLNITANPSLTINGTLMSGTNQYANLTSNSSSAISNLVDCSDFTEQKLLNFVLCSSYDVNSNLIINASNAENSTFNDTLRNISDDIIRLYNFNNSYYYNGTGYEVSGNNTTTDNKSANLETTIYFIQVITTAVVLGIIILATIIGEYAFRYYI